MFRRRALSSRPIEKVRRREEKALGSHQAPGQTPHAVQAGASDHRQRLDEAQAAFGRRVRRTAKGEPWPERPMAQIDGEPSTGGLRVEISEAPRSAFAAGAATEASGLERRTSRRRAARGA